MDNKELVTEIVAEIEKKGYTKAADVQSAIEKVLDEKGIKMDEVKGLQAELEAVKAASIKQGEELASLMNSKNKPENQTLKSIFTEKMDDLRKAVAEKKSFSIHVPFEVLQKTIVLRSSIGSDNQGIVIPEIGRPATATQNVASIIPVWPVGSNSHGVVYYTDQTTATRNADSKAEGAAAPESAAAWTVYSQNIYKILDSIPMSKEVVSDVDWMMAEITNFITENILTKENSQLWSGNNTPPQLNGIYTRSAAFDAAAYGQTFEQANVYDLIMAMSEKIANGYDKKFKATHCVMNPKDVLKMMNSKDANGVYLAPSWVRFNADGTVQVGTITVIPDAVVTANTMLVGDFTKARNYKVGGIELEIGYGSTDFIEDQLTLLGRLREGLLVRNVDAGAFYKSTDMASDIASLTIAGA